MEKHKSHLEEHSGSIKSRTITKQPDRFINRRVELWNDKAFAATLPGTIRTPVGRTIWSKIPRKTCVKKLLNKSGCLKHHALFNKSQCNFFSTGVILMY